MTETSAREEILARIRTALADVPQEAPEQDVPIDWEYGRTTDSAAAREAGGIVELFVERVVDYEAEVVRTDSAGVARAIAEALGAHDARSVVAPTGLERAWCDAIGAAGVTIRQDDPPLTRAELDDIDGVVTACRVAAAETGTIMLDHAPDQGRRALTLVPDVHVCVVRADQVVSDVPEAVAATAASVREHRAPITWISGGSATSDIELSRVEGVHGPRTLVVVLVEG